LFDSPVRIMKSAMLASLVSTAVAGGSLSLTWSDCGSSSTHAKTTDVQPSSLVLGADTAITGLGDLDKQVSGGTYDMELKAGGGLIDSHFTGNNCDKKDFTLPLGLGTLSWDGISCPLAAASGVKIGFHTKLASSLPAALAKSTINLDAKDQDNEQVLCVDLKLAKAESLEDEEASVEEPALDGVPGGVCLDGFITAFIGEAHHIKKCVVNSEHMIKDVAGLIGHLKARKFNQTVQDIQALVQDVGAEIPSCKGAIKDLKPILEAFKGVHSIKDFAQKLENNFLAHDRAILDLLEDELKVCTFGAPDAHKCGADLGKQVRSMVIGDQSSLMVTAPGGVFMAGFIEGFIGKAEHIKACMAQSVKTEQTLVKLVSHIMKYKFKHIKTTIGDIQALIADAAEDLSTCKGAGKELAPLFAAFKGVHSIKDLAKKLENNFLAHDKQILDILENEFKVCTFGAPDAHKCGKDLGRQTRSLVIGDQFSVPVLV